MNSQKIEECLKRLSAAKEICVDVETSGLDWRKCHIVGHVLSFGPRDSDSYYLPVRHGGGGNIPGCHAPDTLDGWRGDIHPLEKEIVKGIDRQGVKVFGQNLSFDLRFLYRVGVRFHADYEDTMLNAALINEWEKSFSLDSLCKVYRVAQKKTNIYDYLESRFPEAKGKGAMGHFWRLAGDDPQAVEYAAGDGVSTWQLRDAQHPQIELQNLQLVHSVECRVIRVLARMMTRGVPIDEERLFYVKHMVETKRKEALESLPKDFNSRAPSQVRKLMEDNGHTDWPMTLPTKAFPNGQPSFNEAWLSSKPIGQKIIMVRKYSNLLASFIEPMIDTHLWNGRCHPEYNQLRGDEYGTITGRLSSSNPNLQQVTKHNEELGRIHRSIFVPDEGMIWGAADYSQMEPRLLAYYTRCKVLMDGYKSDPPLDAHTAVAIACNKNWHDLTKPEQKHYRDAYAKRINQTLITGGGKKVLVSKYKVPADEVDAVWDAYFEAMPEIRSFQRSASQRMSNRGYVISLLGRRCRLNDYSKDYVALNRLLQGGNADCIKLKMVEVDDYLRSEGDKVYLYNNVHDSLDFGFRKEDERIYRESLRIMASFGEQDVIKLDVPITVDTGEGANWAIATFGE